ADEPSANLDSVTGENILDLMKEQNRKEDTTFVFSTHDARVMAHANRIVRLADGKLVSANDPAARDSLPPPVAHSAEGH
ncbi:MAG TPA: ABC transporter ATP-binding protein, partial [Polyangiales bacterium]|nr:ABC transporter ATP-binding protein [Polyangiales bacterium]